MANKIEHRSWIWSCRSRVIGGALVIGAVFLSTASALEAQKAPTYTESVLYTFTGGADGGSPEAVVIRDREGNIYGTTGNGGSEGFGVVFKVDAKGNETALYTFTGGTDGGVPVGGLVSDWEGNLYGTTAAGGDQSVSCEAFGYPGCGVVFKLDRKGKETVLYSFKGGSDGGTPWQEALILDAWGNLYGTTSAGGDLSSAFCNFNGGCGVVFKLDPQGKETVLYTFTGGADGGLPQSGLALDFWGDLYGTTSAGGDLSSAFCYGGCGVVFKVGPSGKETVLHTFTGPDGANPNAGVTLDAWGNLYSTATYGGTLGQGTVFKLDRTGKETVLYNFSFEADGGQPFSGVTLDGAGNLYGTAFSDVNGGVVFQVDPAGQETVLHTFTGLDGDLPYTGVILDCEGNLYGTTREGGSYSSGVVYKLTRSRDDRH